MEFELTIDEKMLLQLLRAALTMQPVDTALFETADDSAWSNCFKLAKKQGVMALAWDGIQTLPKQLLPPKHIKISWAIQVEKFEKRYQWQLQVLTNLKCFYAEQGIALVLLKGVGLSACYPNPSHREGGDLDIYTFSMNHEVRSDEEANRLADQLMEEQGIKVIQENPKHSVFVYQGVTVENHHFFLNKNEIHYAKSVDSYLQKICSPRDVELLEGKFVVPVPSPAFNSIFVPFHAMHHWSEGLSLHQLCDCAILFQKYGINMPTEQMDVHFMNVLSVFIAFANRYLGTSIDVNYSPELFDLMMKEVFRGSYDAKNVNRNFLNIFSYKVRRIIHVLIIRKKVIGESVCARIWYAVRFHVKKPQTIFTLGK